MSFTMSHFEKVDAPSGGRSIPVLTLDANARIYISSAFVEMYDLYRNGIVAANLYYDKNESLLALEMLKVGIAGAFPIRYSTHKDKQAGAFINAKFFCAKYDMMDGEKLQNTYKGRYTASKQSIDSIGEVFIINLKQKRE